MVGSIQIYSIRNKPVPVDLGLVPTLSDQTFDVLEKFQFYIPRSFQEAAELNGRIQKASGWGIGQKLKRVFQIAVGGFLYSEALQVARLNKQSEYLFPALKAVQNIALPFFKGWQLPDCQDWATPENLMWVAFVYTLYSAGQLFTDRFLEKRALTTDLHLDQKNNQIWIDSDLDHVLSKTSKQIEQLKNLASGLDTLKSCNKSASKSVYYEQDQKALLKAAQELDELYRFYRNLNLTRSRSDAA